MGSVVTINKINTTSCCYICEYIDTYQNSYLNQKHMSAIYASVIEWTANKSKKFQSSMLSLEVGPFPHAMN